MPAPPPEDTVVVPADEDPVAAAGSELFGGAPGRRALLGVGWWTAARVLAICTIVVFALGMVQKIPCYNTGWFYGATAQYDHACYSDIPHLFTLRGFSIGNIPYLDKIPNPSPDMQYLEYPVLTGLFMWLAAWLTPSGGGDVHREQVFWLLNAGMLMVCAVIAVIAVMRTHRRRPWDALLFALAPVLALDSTINWDLLAVALTAVGMALWAGRRTVWAGVFIGLATAAKLYPVFLLGPLLVLCWRAGRMRAFGQTLAAATAAWLVVDLPFMLLNFKGWATFYVFSQTRTIDYGSFWLILSQNGVINWSVNTVNTVITMLLALCCLGIAWLALAAPRRPRFAQLAFLIIAAFTLTNKVYSPQYVLWLLPLAALARPRWRDFLVWQVCEVLYFLAIWYNFAYTSSSAQKGLPTDWYHGAIVVHILGTLYLCVMVIRDILMPEYDSVRWDGSDDPSGGVLDRAVDIFAKTSKSAKHGGAVKYPDTVPD
ncbi:MULTISPECIES: glycosyltransferase family 87 protein [Streptacidiphilus]|uniref:Glycosyltransferase family 87 protein n=2 Tax=Streptacidiphilus TaxID=228398 RepID=A0ABV6UNV2_9ACTN|nr:glycosyltransferase 87 family protein [Streptacidiphilus jeojiense]